MSATSVIATKKNGWALSLDVWAVIVSLLAALLIRTGVINHVPW